MWDIFISTNLSFTQCQESGFLCESKNNTFFFWINFFFYFSNVSRRREKHSQQASVKQNKEKSRILFFFENHKECFWSLTRDEKKTRLMYRAFFTYLSVALILILFPESECNLYSIDSYQGIGAGNSIFLNETSFLLPYTKQTCLILFSCILPRCKPKCWRISNLQMLEM